MYIDCSFRSCLPDAQGGLGGPCLGNRPEGPCLLPGTWVPGQLSHWVSTWVSGGARAEAWWHCSLCVCPVALAAACCCLPAPLPWLGQAGSCMGWVTGARMSSLPQKCPYLWCYIVPEIYPSAFYTNLLGAWEDAESHASATGAEMFAPVPYSPLVITGDWSPGHGPIWSYMLESLFQIPHRSSVCHSVKLSAGTLA